MARIHQFDGSFDVSSGVNYTPTADEKYLRNLPGPPGGDNSRHRYWRADRTFMTLNDDGLLEWQDTVAGTILRQVTGSTAPTKTTAINSKQTLTFGGAAYMDAIDFELDPDINTIYAVIRPTDPTGLTVLFGPDVSPVAGAPTDDVLAFGLTDGRPRLLTDAGSASLLTDPVATDYRDDVVLFCVTMSNLGKAFATNGVETIRDAAMVTALTETGFRLGRFGTGAGLFFTGDVRALLITPGQDMTESYFSGAHAGVTSRLMSDAGL